MIKNLLSISLLSLSIASYGQSPDGTFQVLNVPYTAPLTAMGGYNVSWVEGYNAQFISNPAAPDSLEYAGSFHYLNFSGAYSLFSATYHQKVSRGILNGAVRQVAFGDFNGFDAAGNPTNQFNANQTVITLGYKLRSGHFHYGLNMDFSIAGISGFRSSALSFTLGGLFVHPTKDLSVGMTLKNIGFVINDYTTTSDSQLPIDALVGVSFKPEFMPFRFSLTARQLFETDLLNDQIDDNTFKEVMSHFIVGTEIVISRNISVLLGYNHLIRQELKLQQQANSAGFSYGFMWHNDKWNFSFGRGAYHAAGAMNTFSLLVDIDKLFSKI